MNQNTGITRIIKAFAYSVAGLKATWINEAAFRQELYFTIILLPLALIFGENAIEQALLISSLFLVLITELINSGIEAIADCLTTERHPLIKRAKDVGSAAVFLALCYTVLVWGLILWP